MSMAACNHKPVGIITNQPDGYDKDRPLFSRTVCARPECQQRTFTWVFYKAHEEGTFKPFPKYGAL